MNRERRIIFNIGIFLLLTEIIKQWSLKMIYGHYIWWNFPFQLCSIPMYLCLVLPFLKKETFYGAGLSFLSSFGFMGGICAFLDTTGMHYPKILLTFHSYLWHVILIFLGIYSAWCLWKRGTGKGSFAGACSIYGFCIVLAEIFNLSFEKYGEINMFYINPHHEMSQIVFDRIAEKTSNTCSILLYICCSVIGAYCFYSIWKFLLKKDR